ncbi:MAG: transglutaminase family protein, partial [Gammaproteobacteria bacterium]|nr:transglutaminase family protein [Gammaproteobacteria bacterium]
MTLQVALAHKTSYVYDRRVKMGPQVIRLRPAPHSQTPIVSYSLALSPDGYFLNWQQDPHGNYLARVVYPDPVEHFEVNVDLVADMKVRNPFDFFLEPDAEHVPFEYDEILRGDLEPYLERDASSARLREWVAALPKQKDQPTTDFIVDLNRRIQQDVSYVIRMEPGVQTPEQTLTLGSGSCRDSGWLLVQVLRELGYASRFVSGYLIQLVADVKSLDGPSGTDVDFTDLHAWAEVYLPGAGWVGLDPTSGLLAGEGHIPLAATPHPISAAPITGNVDPCETQFHHEMSVVRVKESPRVTKPYSDQQWSAIEAFGRDIDRRLKRDDVRLTIGGEPTFVSRDDPDGAEWNTAATGPTKRRYAYNLIRRLRDRFAPDALLHLGQGKWYPGEQLPRWAFSLYWRRDGAPLWSTAEALAGEGEDYSPTHEQSEALLKGIAKRLEVGTKTIAPVYEDPWHFINQERKLPENLTAETNELDDPMARARLARVFERGLGTPVGHVLPLQIWQAKDGRRRWMTGRWSTRSGKLYLVPGDSPVGYRLPLPSLPYLSPREYPYILPTDPMAVEGDLPSSYAHRQPFRQRRAAADDSAQTLVGQVADSDDGLVRAALAIEPRDGRLCVFMPPVTELRDYLDLVAAVEDAAAELDCKIAFEG